MTGKLYSSPLTFKEGRFQLTDSSKILQYQTLHRRIMYIYLIASAWGLQRHWNSFLLPKKLIGATFLLGHGTFELFRLTMHLLGKEIEQFLNALIAFEKLYLTSNYN